MIIIIKNTIFFLSPRGVFRIVYYEGTYMPSTCHQRMCVRVQDAFTLGPSSTTGGTHGTIYPECPYYVLYNTLFKFCKVVMYYILNVFNILKQFLDNVRAQQNQNRGSNYPQPNPSPIRL